MTPRTQLAYAAAGAVLVLGLLSLLNPGLASRLLGLEIVTPRGLSEFRSTYGALHVTMAALLLWAVPLRPKTGGMVRVMGLLWLGAAGGRAASLAIDPVLTPDNVGLLLLQLAVGVVLVWASFETPPSGAEAQAAREAKATQRRLAKARKRLARGGGRAAAPPPGSAKSEPAAGPAKADRQDDAAPAAAGEATRGG